MNILNLLMVSGVLLIQIFLFSLVFIYIIKRWSNNKPKNPSPSPNSPRSSCSIKATEFDELVDTVTTNHGTNTHFYITIGQKTWKVLSK